MPIAGIGPAIANPVFRARGTGAGERRGIRGGDKGAAYPASKFASLASRQRPSASFFSSVSV